RVQLQTSRLVVGKNTPYVILLPQAGLPMVPASPEPVVGLSVNEIARFQEQLYLLTSNGTEGHVPVHCTDGFEFYSNSGPHSPVRTRMTEFITGAEEAAEFIPPVDFHNHLQGFLWNPLPSPTHVQRRPAIHAVIGCCRVMSRMWTPERRPPFADVNATKERGWTGTHDTPSQNGRQDIGTLSVRMDVRTLGRCPSEWTSGRWDVVRQKGRQDVILLLTTRGELMSAEESRRFTPLHIGSLSGHKGVESVEFISSKGVCWDAVEGAGLNPVKREDTEFQEKIKELLETELPWVPRSTPANCNETVDSMLGKRSIKTS
ncbi:unnamed protein product, partial [Cyprideis torosa]